MWNDADTVWYFGLLLVLGYHLARRIIVPKKRAISSG
jgi:hypothetical protein